MSNGYGYASAPIKTGYSTTYTGSGNTGGNDGDGNSALSGFPFRCSRLWCSFAATSYKRNNSVIACRNGDSKYLHHPNSFY